jgi:hypothetical protein
MMIALAISAMLLTATMFAIDASFRAYANAAEQASAQSGTRMITNRVLTLIRTSTAHGPLLPELSGTPPVTLHGDTIHSHYLELVDPNDDIIRIEYRSDLRELWLIKDPGESTQIAQPLIGGVTNAQFFARRRRNEVGIWVLERGTIDFTVLPGPDSSLAIESGTASPIRMVASTQPRKIED